MQEGTERSTPPGAGPPPGAALTDGEAWTRDALARLRAGRFAPRAVAAFLLASHRRAADVRAARPDLARQARRWTAAGAVAYVPAVRAGAASGRGAATWWTATALMLDWHLGMLETEDGTPRPLGPADALTLARTWLVPLAHHRPHPAHAALAFATDALDGIAARATAPTRAGRDLEGLADAAFALAALHAARRDDAVARAAVAAELARVGVGTASATALWLAHDRPDPALLRAARWTTPLRAAALAAAAAGRRRDAGVLLAAGSGLSLAALAYSTMRPSRPT